MRLYNNVLMDSDKIFVDSGVNNLLNIFIDADACPVKQEVYRVAKRYQLDVILVANSWMKVPNEKRITLKVVDDNLDAADDWIVDKVLPGDIVIDGFRYIIWS